jgi:hypothetical protein
MANEFAPHPSLVVRRFAIAAYRGSDIEDLAGLKGRKM